MLWNDLRLQFKEKDPLSCWYLVAWVGLNDFLKRFCPEKTSAEVMVSLTVGMGLMARLSKYAFDVSSGKGSPAPARLLELLAFALFPIGLAWGPHLSIS